jgi:hypothetical protein
MTVAARVILSERAVAERLARFRKLVNTPKPARDM